MMKKTFSGELVSYTNQTNVVQEIKAGLPRDVFAGHRRRDDLALLGHRRRDRGGRELREVARSISHHPRAHRHLDACFWLGIIVRYYLAEGGLATWFPDGEYVPFTTRPSAMVLAHDPAVGRARGALHRLLRQGASLEHPRHDQRGLRAHRAREGPQPAQRDARSTLCGTR